jgi:ribosomal protein L16 Arg81 hydroxylase
MTDKNPITGDLLQSRMNSKEFEENFDRIFRQRINNQKMHNEDLAEYELNKSTGEVQKVDNGNKPNTVKP